MGVSGNAPGSEGGSDISFGRTVSGVTPIRRGGRGSLFGGAGRGGLKYTGMETILGSISDLADIDKVSAVAIDAISQASESIVRDAKANLAALLKPPPDTGNLLNSLGYVIYDNAKYNGTVYSVIGPKWPKGAHGHLFEKGTVERFRATKSGVKVSAGKMPGQEFLAPAVAANRSRSFAVMQRVTQQGVGKLGRAHGG